jgi:hypothetical protein
MRVMEGPTGSAPRLLVVSVTDRVSPAAAVGGASIETTRSEPLDTRIGRSTNRPCSIPLTTTTPLAKKG